MKLHLNLEPHNRIWLCRLSKIRKYKYFVILKIYLLNKLWVKYIYPKIIVLIFRFVYIFDATVGLLFFNRIIISYWANVMIVVRIWNCKTIFITFYKQNIFYLWNDRKINAIKCYFFMPCWLLINRYNPIKILKNKLFLCLPNILCSTTYFWTIKPILLFQTLK